MKSKQAPPTPYTWRSLAEIQAEIDAYEENTPHDQLPPRYDALVRFRNSRSSDFFIERRNQLK
jgi:hypothetical protein